MKRLSAPDDRKEFPRSAQAMVAIALGMTLAIGVDGAMAGPGSIVDRHEAPDTREATDPYRWDELLTGTYWFVPTDALPAELHQGSSILPIEQQTVYYIESSRRGVFKGWMVTQFTTQATGTDFPISCQDMFGTIAPRGEISLTVVTPSTGGVVHPWPVSYMQKVKGQWLNMVLASTIIGDGSSFITHGPTYMTPITSRSPYWDNLPGTPGAVPEFVSQCGHEIDDKMPTRISSPRG